jgi:UDP-glucose 4-epimerase
MTAHLKLRSAKHVLITGGAGFIGSHLAEELLRQNYTVTVIDDLSTGRFSNIEHLVDHPRFHFAIDTITNEVVMDRLASECDTIFHLAAAVGVMLIVEKPVHTISTNIMGTEAVLKAALRYKAKVIIASTSEVYGKGNQIPFSENDDVVLGPTSRSRWGYAASKMVDEFLGLAYYREKDLPVIILRLFNTVGPRQTGRYGMVIPRFVKQALAGEPLSVFGDGDQSRCFLHVKDTVAALVALSGCTKAAGQVFNVGSTHEVSMNALAQMVVDRAAASGSDPVEIQHIPYDQAYAVGFEDMRRRVPDISKIREFTGWKPERSLENILEDVIASVRSENKEN